MVEVINKLANLPKTKAYADFGLKQVEAINKKFHSWLAEQAFSKNGISSEFTHMSVKGTHDDQKYPDKIEWDLCFSDKVKNKSLSDALLHENRYPNITAFNSKPNLFDTSNYIQISVTNDEKDWVKKGEFPVNVYVGKDYEFAMSQIPLQEPQDIAIQTDVKREALAGFKAAYEWQKFRAMALACSNFVATQLANESKDKETDYDVVQHRRSRRENVYRFFVQLLPDTRLEKGASALKSFYMPGTLEGVLALELEHAMQHQFGDSKKGEIRPIYLVKGYPIEITSNDDGYDALMKFNVQTIYAGGEDEQVRLAIENQLKKHYNVKLKTTNEMEVAFELKDAHEVEKKIKDNIINTELHEFAWNFGDALRHTDAFLREWYGKKIPALEEEYKKKVNNKRNDYFSELELKFASKSI